MKINKAKQDPANGWVLSRLEDGVTVDKIKFGVDAIVPFSFNIKHTKKNLKKRLMAVDADVADLLSKKL